MFYPTSHHVLHQMLPPYTGYNLSQRSHSLTLSSEDSNFIRKNFLHRMLFRDIYKVFKCIILFFFIIVQCSCCNAYSYYLCYIVSVCMLMFCLCLSDYIKLLTYLIRNHTLPDKFNQLRCIYYHIWILFLSWLSQPTFLYGSVWHKILYLNYNENR